MLSGNGDNDVEMQSVWIQSKFPFGNCLLEAIDMISMNPSNSLSDSKLIRTSMILDNATVGRIFNYFVAAYIDSVMIFYIFFKQNV